MPKPFIKKTAQSFDFFRQNYRLMLKISVLLLILILGVIGALFYQHFTAPKLQYFITTLNGKLFELSPTID
jgi:hypothetical protein